MMVPSGASRKRTCQGGYAGLAIILAVTGLLSVVVLLGPSLIQSRVQARQFDENARLERIADQLLKSIKATQYIPSPTNWSETLAAFSGLNQKAIQQVYPNYPNDLTTRRVLLVDPSVGITSLPYAQGTDGLSGTLTNLAGPGARVLLLSNSRRGLALPVTSGFANSVSEFNAIWNWTLNPATKTPPSGWPSSWNGFGDELHVTRINLANLFHAVQLSNARYALDTNRVSLAILPKVDPTIVGNLLSDPGDAGITTLITTPIEMIVLDGTLFKIYDTNGVLFEARRVNSDVAYEFSTTNAAPPVVHYKFSETSGSIATNSGSYGSTWNGIYTNGVTFSIKEPRPPAFPTFSTNNFSVYFDGNKSYVETGRILTNVLHSFTLAAWINPEQLSSSTIYIAGVRNSLSLNYYKPKRSSSMTLRISTKTGGSLGKAYPYALKTWHHVAAVGTGTRLQLYVDGILISQKSYSTANYYYNSGYTFRVGANPQISRGSLRWGSSPQFKGGIDEVVFYDRALDADEISTLAAGKIP